MHTIIVPLNKHTYIEPSPKHRIRTHALGHTQAKHKYTCIEAAPKEINTKIHNICCIYQVGVQLYHNSSQLDISFCLCTLPRPQNSQTYTSTRKQTEHRKRYAHTQHAYKYIYIKYIYRLQILPMQEQQQQYQLQQFTGVDDYKNQPAEKSVKNHLSIGLQCKKKRNPPFHDPRLRQTLTIRKTRINKLVVSRQIAYNTLVAKISKINLQLSYWVLVIPINQFQPLK
eukprot:TRINITY_DN24195_c0_g3_i3.p2 TRINITY_DN24195_c0_g3~~TRINITY_DN24195_c0_g3_i3.p2  ORF type:complete len:227 (+),score=-6.76 TRINITY_DN24195_c0_g3_i3:617-1297(+)